MGGTLKRAETGKPLPYRISVSMGTPVCGGKIRLQYDGRAAILAACRAINGNFELGFLPPRCGRNFGTDSVKAV